MSLAPARAASWWKLLARTANTPLRPISRRIFGQVDMAGLWASFRPSAWSVGELLVKFRHDAAEQSIEEAAEILRRHGIVAVTGLLPEGLVWDAAEDADDLLQVIQEASSSGEQSGEILGSLWQSGPAVVKTYFGMINHNKPVIFIRSREADIPDAGMIDIFQFDRLAREQNRHRLMKLLHAEENRLVDEIVRRLLPWRAKSVNLYHNESVTNTRVLHVDSLDFSYKAFIYLRDVERLADGPYTFVPGSHRQSSRLARSVFLNRVNGRCETDIPEAKGRQVAMLAPRGTVIISCQAGIHGGEPQEEDGLRTAIVTAYLKQNVPSGA